MTAPELLALLDRVKSRGIGRYSARCPAHTDTSPSLSIQEGDKGLLLKCWAGCELTAITRKLRIEIKDLFYNNLPDPRQRREAMQRRAKEQAAQRSAGQARGRRTDALREAEYFIESARGITIENWTHAELDKRLNALADAYQILEREDHDA